MRGFLKKNKYQKLYTEGKIQTALFKAYFDSNSFLLRNKYVYDWESDFFYVIGKGNIGLGVEYEIKNTRSDWAKEVKGKKEKHEFLKKTFYAKGENLKEGDKEEYCPSYFIITCPKDLIQVEEVEDNFPFASLYWVDGDKIIVKKKVKIHNVKQDYKQLLIFKLYDEIIRHESRLINLLESKAKIDECEDCCGLIENFLKTNRIT